MLKNAKNLLKQTAGAASRYSLPLPRGKTNTPNLRALRLALSISDQLLSMGVSAASVVSRTLDITETYCKQPVHIDINSNLIMLSQLRGLEEEPLTLIRPTVSREVNNHTIHAIQDLVYRIRLGEVKLGKAEVELETILKKPKAYPAWFRPMASAGIALGVALMFTTRVEVILLTFVIAYIVEKLLDLMYRGSMISFFRQVAAACFVTLAAAAANALAYNGVNFFEGMNPSLIVVGGIIMLLSGLAIVGAIQDAIDEYYITANARILKVMMMTSGIVIGVLIGLYIARKLGIGIAVSPDPLSLTELKYQIVGGGLAAGAFALSTHTRPKAAIWAGILGGVALSVMYLARDSGVAVIPASGVAAMMVGALAKGLSRLWRTPASGIIAAGIIPLVPGLALYTGLMQLVNYPPGDPLFFRGVGTLFTAFATALAIAAGASFGNMLTRPFNQRHTHLRNIEPFVQFMRYQLKTGRLHGRLAGFALRRTTEHFKKPTDNK